MLLRLSSFPNRYRRQNLFVPPNPLGNQNLFAPPSLFASQSPSANLSLFVPPNLLGNQSLSENDPQYANTMTGPPTQPLRKMMISEAN